MPLYKTTNPIKYENVPIPDVMADNEIVDEVIALSNEINGDGKFIFPSNYIAGSTVPENPGFTATPGNQMSRTEKIDKSHQGTGPGWNTKRPRAEG